MIEFRPATEADVDALIPMMRVYYAEDGYPFDEAESRSAAGQLVRDSRLGQLWVLDDNGRAAGYVAVTLGFSLECRGRDAFVDELYLAESHRGLGLGRRALEIAEAWCLEQGVKALHLEVERHRERALNLYLQFGFADDDRHLMTKALSG